MSFSRKKEPFSQVKIPSERKRVFNQLVGSPHEIILKGPGDQLSFLRPLQISDFRFLKCQYNVNSFEVPPADCLTEHFGQFQLGQDRYFFHSPISISEPHITLDVSGNLFLLQRRSSIRLSLPAELKAVANIINHNERTALLESRIVDISTGGLKLELPLATVQTWKATDSLVLVLHLGKRIPFQVEGLIRHLGSASAETPDSVLCGIEFINKTSILEHKLLAIQMDLQSEIFRKLKKYSYTS